jgi:chemotaxis protein CheX
VTTDLTSPAATAVDAAQIDEILAEVLSSLALDSYEVPPVDLPIVVTGSVSISGSWSGAVLIELPAGAEVSLTAAMFAMGPDEVGPEEISDAVGELANMVGGVVKSLMPEPSRLSLPQVVSGDGLHLTIPGAIEVARVSRQVGEHVVSASAWWSPGS